MSIAEDLDNCLYRDLQHLFTDDEIEYKGAMQKQNDKANVVPKTSSPSLFFIGICVGLAIGAVNVMP